MKMNKVISMLVLIILVSSCTKQQKTVELANGTTVTQKQYDKILNNAFKSADKAGRDAVKSKLSKKQIREFREGITFEVDTLGN
jgi:uncharacterized lipoprotein YajG